jgi:hypothetical protein
LTAASLRQLSIERLSVYFTTAARETAASRCYLENRALTYLEEHFVKLYLRKYFSLPVLALISLALTPGVMKASNITLQGLFTLDDNVQLFDVVVSTPGSVDIRTYSYAGGLTSTGRVVPSGGFDPVLTLFDSAGIFLADNDEGAGVASDPNTGEAFDARITTNLTPGSYIVALTQFDNFAAGDLASGFVEAGLPHFTADPAFTAGAPCPDNLFRDISNTAGRCRNGNWAVDFVNVASATARSPSSVPEPNAALLLGSGLIALGLALLKREINCRNGVSSCEIARALNITQKTA